MLITRLTRIYDSRNFSRFRDGAKPDNRMTREGIYSVLCDENFHSTMEAYHDLLSLREGGYDWLAAKYGEHRLRGIDPAGNILFMSRSTRNDYIAYVLPIIREVCISAFSYSESMFPDHAPEVKVKEVNLEAMGLPKDKKEAVKYLKEVLDDEEELLNCFSWKEAPGGFHYWSDKALSKDRSEFKEAVKHMIKNDFNIPSDRRSPMSDSAALSYEQLRQYITTTY